MAVKAGEGTAGGPALRTARDRGEERQSCTRVWTLPKSLPLPSVSDSLAKRLRDEPAGCNTVEQMHSNERCLAAPRALHVRPSPPILATSWLAAWCCQTSLLQPKTCTREHTQRSALLCCPMQSHCEIWFRKCHLCHPPISPCWHQAGKSPECCPWHPSCW